ncbi:MAG: zinc ribbon domain-containing protein [bacterium]
MVEVIGVALVIITMVLISYPLWQKSQRKVSFALNHQNEEWQARKAEVYAAIRDIELDYRMGKLSEEDYQSLRDQYKNEAIQIMKKLDVSAAPAVTAKKAPAARQLNGRFCHHCGQPAQSADQFCSACGANLA